MFSKTPKFEAAINEILENLKPHAKNCKQCGVNFDILEEDIEFYKKFQVPAPTLCPNCRMQRRLGCRINFLPIFYKKKCGAPEHNEMVISLFPPNNKVKIYDDEYYFSDKWDALEFGRDYDFEKYFFGQFKDLSLVVPHQRMHSDPNNVNSEYAIAGRAAKNCYYMAMPYYSENVYYSSSPLYSKHCIDVNNTDYSEMCYETILANHCYNCSFCHESNYCMDSYFLFDCHNCSSCFGCVNLRNRSYCFFNRQLSAEEYKEKISKINLGKRSVLKQWQMKFKEYMDGAIKKNFRNIKAENSFGDDLHECKNCFYSFRIFGGSENLRYACIADKVNNSMDTTSFADSSWVYETIGVSPSSNIKFSMIVRNGLNLEYCVECRNCQDCFGCFGLRNKQFCIFNKQYNEKEYWGNVDKIKIQMLKNKEYGEFFPLTMSQINYIDSNASIYFPLTKEEIIKNGWYWEEETRYDVNLTQLKILKTTEVPDDISDVSDDILKSAIICGETGKPFLITGFELEFYRKHNLPLPTVHPLQRIKNRFSLMRPFRLWQYPCSKCGEMMHSSLDPIKKLKVCCERCYRNEVI